VTIEKRIFGYQKSLYDNLLVPNTNNSLQHDKHKHLWVRKATGVDLMNSCEIDLFIVGRIQSRKSISID
jgi:hypothetical protein